MKRAATFFWLVVAGAGCGGAGSASGGEAGSGGGSSGGSGSGGGTGGLGNSETGAGTGGMPTGTGGVSPTASTGEVGTSGTGETGETGASSSTGCSFICETAGDHDPHECDNFAQDCPEGQKCTAWAEGGGGSWNALKCVPVMGDKQPGEPCFAPEGGTSGLDDCAEAVMCFYVDETNMGVCVALCSGSPEAPVCPDDDSCTIAAGGELNLCLPECDPLVQDCPGGDPCIPYPNNEGHFVCTLDASGEEGQANDGCEFANACDKGLACLDPAEASSACDPQAAGCCQPFCEFPDGVCPNPDQACVQWYDPMELSPDSPKLKYGICKISG